MRYCGPAVLPVGLHVPMREISLEQLSLADFAGLRHSRFRVQADARNTVELELVEATPAASGSSPPSGNFSLLFHGPLRPILAQRIHRFEHDQLGRFDLFIVPVGQTDAGTQYQAVFNRLIRPE